MTARRKENDRLTILLVTSMHSSPAFPLRGIVVDRLVGALRTLGHRVELFRLGGGGGPLRYVQARREVRSAIAALNPNVVHAVFGYSGVAVPRSRVPLVTTFHGDDLNGTVGPRSRVTWASRIGIVASQLVALRSARCIAVSKALRQRLWFSAARAKTIVIRDAVDPNLFRPLPRTDARRRLGVEADAILVMFPHDVTQATKRVDLASAATRVLQTGVPTARLWVVNGVTPDEMPWHYAAADIVIVTSMFEGGPSCVKEALACGIPVVSVPVGDVDLFDEARDGLVRAEPTADGLARAMRLALERLKRDERKPLLPPGLTLDQAARRVVGVYREALGW